LSVVDSTKTTWTPAECTTDAQLAKELRLLSRVLVQGQNVAPMPRTVSFEIGVRRPLGVTSTVLSVSTTVVITVRIANEHEDRPMAFCDYEMRHPAFVSCTEPPRP
jgi:hypothetical protein